MITYKIDKDVPIPPKLDNPRQNTKYPWSTMEIGDSFLVEVEDVPKGSVAQGGNRWAIYNDNSRRFKEEFQEDGSLRVWRIA